MLLAIAGMVGTGKSTLTQAIATRFGLQRALESVDAENPWLEPYYGEPEGMRRFALPLQLHFLATRFAALRRMRARGGGWVLDRTWYEDAEIFARGLFERGQMTAAEFDLYGRLYAELLHSPAARPPALLVYLHGPLDEILGRIERRGRPKERDTARPYWEELHRRYEDWVATFHRCPVLRVDIRDYDLVESPASLDAVTRLVRDRVERGIPQPELWDG
jgi:deoxyadenosine/deoxycytidine kinase